MSLYTPEEQQKIEEYKLIASFMGWQMNVHDHLPNKVYSADGSRGMAAIHLRYAEDWGQLMPVIEKIAGTPISDEIPDTHYPRTFGMKNVETGDFMFRFNCACLFQAPNLIDAAYAAVLDFVKHLN